MTFDSRSCSRPPRQQEDESIIDKNKKQQQQQQISGSDNGSSVSSRLPAGVIGTATTTTGAIKAATRRSGVVPIPKEFTATTTTTATTPSLNIKNKRTRRRRNKYLCFDKRSAATLVGLVLIILYALLITVGPFLLLRYNDKSTWCPYNNDHPPDARRQVQTSSRILKTSKSYPNPDYTFTDPCRYYSTPRLLFLSLEQCDFCTRIMVSALLGGLIGYERQLADRPAGVRMMGLVSLGSCFFTVCSIMAFKSAPMGWDSSRVTADLPKGVGFLGAALIWKGTITSSVDDGQQRNQVHGLTTAASVWLSAAVGAGAGGALYEVSFYGTFIVLLVLRYGPRLYNPRAVDDDDEGEEEEDGSCENPANNREAADLQKQLDSLDKILSTPTLVGMAGNNKDNETTTLDESLLRKVRSEANLIRRRRSSKRNIIPTYGS